MKSLKVEIADTPYKLAQGLMFVEHLPDDDGMLFVFKKAEKLNFWGRNTLIPLDIAFIDSVNVIKRIGHISPLSLSPVSSESDCIMAIEANGGFFARNEIKVGDKIDIKKEKGSPDNAVISFNNNKGINQDTQKNEGCNSGLKPELYQHTKESQVVLPAEKVEKPDIKTVGTPISDTAPSQVDSKDLPILTKEDIGRLLEDSFDEEKELEAPEVPEAPEAKETVPEEVPTEVVEPEKPEYPVFNTAFQAAEWAEHNNEVMRISYTTKRGRQIERDIEPHGQFHSDSTYRQILVTFDRTIGDIRAFILSNVKNWAFLGTKFNKKFVVKA